MADFAKWATACEGAYDTPGTFLKAYSENRTNAVSALLAEDMVASGALPTSVRFLSTNWSRAVSSVKKATGPTRLSARR
jgi:hypothetical protein